MAESVRCFIAIELPETLKHELTELESILKKRSPPLIKWVEPQGIHLTLKFLGAVDADKLDEVEMALDEAVLGLKPFDLSVQEVGAFPNLNRVQVIWVGVKGELDKLAHLQKQIDFNTEQLGFPREERAFTAHLTLGRVHNYTAPDDRRKIGQVISETVFSSAVTVTVESVNLMKSQLTPAGAIYSRLYAAPLKT